jgi:hypothetical protein
VKVRADSSDVRGLHAHIEAAGDKAPEGAHKVLKRGALNVKKGAQAAIQGIAHAPHYPRSITYDTTWSGTAGTAEIGPDKNRKQGPLGHILEYGLAQQNTAPHAHLGPALDIEGPNFERALGDLGEDLLS